jgi:hypothetical protein
LGRKYKILPSIIIILEGSIIRELPARDPFHFFASAGGTNCIKGGIYPFIAASATVAENIIVVGDGNFLLPISEIGDILLGERF